MEGEAPQDTGGNKVVYAFPRPYSSPYFPPAPGAEVRMILRADARAIPFVGRLREGSA